MAGAAGKNRWKSAYHYVRRVWLFCEFIERLVDNVDTLGGCSALLIELPQPGEDVEVPMSAKVAANASVTLRRDAASGDGMVQNGVSSLAQYGPLVYFLRSL